MQLRLLMATFVATSLLGSEFAQAEPVKVGPPHAVSLNPHRDPSPAQLGRQAVCKVRLRRGTTTVIGSGFFVQDSETVVTNYHVVKSAESGEVLLEHQDSATPIELVSIRPEHDLALLRLKRRIESVKPLIVASDVPAAGHEVFALGYPHDIGFTITRGIVSGVRIFGDLPDSIKLSAPFDPASVWIQTDAAINSGNSGGPLLTSDGHVIGVNTWRWRNSDGLNFALSATHLADLLKSAPSHPIGFVRAKEMLVEKPSPSAATPTLDLHLDRPAQAVRDAVNALKNALPCDECRGDGAITKRVPAGTSDGRGFGTAQFTTKSDTCTKCRGSGLDDFVSLERPLSRTVAEIARLDFNDPKASSALEHVKRVLREHLSPRLNSIFRSFNDAAVAASTTTSPRVGGTIACIGILTEDLSNGSQRDRTLVIRVVGRDLTVLIIAPPIIDCTVNDHVFAAGLLRGFVELDGRTVPVLHGSFVISGSLLNEPKLPR